MVMNVGWKVHMTSYLLLITFLTNWIQALQHLLCFDPFDPAKNAIQGDASEGSDTF